MFIDRHQSEEQAHKGHCLASSRGKQMKDVVQQVLGREDFSGINSRNTHNMTCLHNAAWLDDSDMCRMIVEHPRFEAIVIIINY